MAIDLPVRGKGPAGNRRASGLPGAEDVRRAGVSRDPGVAIPQGAFSSGLEGVGEIGFQITDAVARATERQSKEYDATQTTEAYLGYDRDVTDSLTEAQQKDDPARPGFLKDYDDRMRKQAEERLANLPEGVTAEAKERLRLRMLETQGAMYRQAGKLSLQAGSAKADDAYGRLVNRYAQQAMTNPDQLDRILNDAEDSAAEFAGVWTADRERDAIADARQTAILSAIDGMAEQKRFDDARAVLADERFTDEIEPAARSRAGNAIDAAEKAYKAELERKERERVAELRDHVSDAIVVLEAGKVPPLLGSLRGQVRGTPLEAALQEAEEDAGAMAEFNAAPLPEQRAALRGMQEQETATARDVRLGGRMARAYAGHVKAVKDDPIGYGAELGLYDLAEVDFNEPATLKARQRQARVASEHFGTKVPAFRPAEINALKDSVDRMSPDQAAAMFRSLNSGLGEATAIETAGQIAGSDPALGVAVASSIDSPLLAAEIVRGQRLLKENKPEIPAVQMRAEISSIYGDMFSDVPGALNPYVEAAKAIYAARRVPGGDMAFDVETFQTALRLAAGGAVLPDGSVTGGPVEFNDKTIIPPVAGMGEDEFGDLVEGLDIGAMTRFGNGTPTFGDGAPFDPALFDTGMFGAREAQFVTVGVGRYRVLLPGIGYVQNETGDLYEIDLRRMATEAVPARTMK